MEGDREAELVFPGKVEAQDRAVRHAGLTDDRGAGSLALPIPCGSREHPALRRPVFGVFSVVVLLLGLRFGNPVGKRSMGHLPTVFREGAVVIDAAAQRIGRDDCDLPAWNPQHAGECGIERDLVVVDAGDDSRHPVAIDQADV